MYRIDAFIEGQDSRYYVTEHFPSGYVALAIFEEEATLFETKKEAVEFKRKWIDVSYQQWESVTFRLIQIGEQE